MSQNVLEDINKKMDEMVEGRRYIIRQVGSLKVSVDELIEKLGSGALKSGGAETVDLTGLTPLIQGLSEEIVKLQDKSLEKNIKESFDKMEELLKEIKDSTSTLQENISNVKVPEGGVNVNEIMDKIDEVRSESEDKISKVLDEIKGISERLMEVKAPEESVIKERIEGISAKILEIDSNLQKLLEERVAVKDTSSNGLKDTVNKLVGIVLDLKANIDESEETFNYGLKVIENNLKKELAGVSKSQISCEADAFEKLRSEVSGNPTNEEVYDTLLDILYHIKKSNKFDRRIAAILELIKEARTRKAESTIDNDLKEKLKELF
mgnify:CR=1 FL=1